MNASRDIQRTRERAELGALLRELRERRGFTHEEAAGRIARHPAYLCAVEAGRRRLALTDLRVLTELYGATLLDFVGTLEGMLKRPK